MRVAIFIPWRYDPRNSHNRHFGKSSETHNWSGRLENDKKIWTVPDIWVLPWFYSTKNDSPSILLYVGPTIKGQPFKGDGTDRLYRNLCKINCHSTLCKPPRSAQNYLKPLRKTWILARSVHNENRMCMCGFCKVWVCVCVGFVMCGCFGNMCTCIYCVLYCFYCFYVPFRLCILFVLSVLV